MNGFFIHLIFSVLNKTISIHLACEGDLEVFLVKPPKPFKVDGGHVFTVAVCCVFRGWKPCKPLGKWRALVCPTSTSCSWRDFLLCAGCPLLSIRYYIFSSYIKHKQSGVCSFKTFFFPYTFIFLPFLDDRRRKRKNVEKWRCSGWKLDLESGLVQGRNVVSPCNDARLWVT